MGHAEITGQTESIVLHATAESAGKPLGYSILVLECWTSHSETHSGASGCISEEGNWFKENKKSPLLL